MQYEIERDLADVIGSAGRVAEELLYTHRRSDLYDKLAQAIALMNEVVAGIEAFDDEQ